MHLARCTLEVHYSSTVARLIKKFVKWQHFEGVIRDAAETTDDQLTLRAYTATTAPPSEQTPKLCTLALASRELETAVVE